MVQLRESLFLEKQKTIDAMREELEHERREISSRSEERYENQIAELEAILKVGQCTQFRRQCGRIFVAIYNNELNTGVCHDLLV